MTQIFKFEATWPLRAAAGLVALCAIAAFEMRSFDTHMWTDELLTLKLLQANHLTQLWAGIASGIDGNPPLYLTLAWFIAGILPSSVSFVAVLRTLNLLIVIAATLTLYRLSLRAATTLAALIGLFLFLALNSNLAVLATELRTYALYYFLAVLAVLLQQRLNEHGRKIDAVLLTLGYAALTLSHTFGILYVGCVAISGYASRWEQGWRRLKPTILAPIPSVLIFACWFPFFLQQSAAGKPYLWVTAPDLSQMVLIMWSTPLSMWIALVELFCLAGAAFATLRLHYGAAWRGIIGDPKSPYARYIVAVAVSVSCVTIGMWIFSQFIFPIFVPRYFVPQIMVSAALHVAFCELFVRAVRERSNFSLVQSARWAAVVLPVLFSVILLQRSNAGQDRCTDNHNGFFESRFVRGNLPVIADSPHVFMPRAYYAAHGAAYRFPLDWNVVLKYPTRDRGNATDYHVFESLRDWLPMPSAISTDDIVRDYPQFLVIESDRAWFDNLRQTWDVSAEKLAEVDTPLGGTCTLWMVASVKALPPTLGGRADASESH